MRMLVDQSCFLVDSFVCGRCACSRRGWGGPLAWAFCGDQWEGGRGGGAAGMGLRALADVKAEISWTNWDSYGVCDVE